MVGPTIFGHAAAGGAIAVAAVPFNDADQARGVLLARAGDPLLRPGRRAPPAPTAADPRSVAKPDIAATDCGATTFFAFLPAAIWRFCGTSAAAPHAAAVAALPLRGRTRRATLQEIRAAQASTATPVGAFGPKAVGAGLIDADAAVAALLPPATIEIDEHPESRTADPTPTFGWEATAGTEFTCSIDEVAPEPCASPYTLPGPLPDGPHVFEVDAVDAIGSAAFSFTVDTTPPGIQFVQRPPALSAIAKPTFAFTASEPASIVLARSTGRPHSPANRPMSLPPLSPTAPTCSWSPPPTRSATPLPPRSPSRSTRPRRPS